MAIFGSKKEVEKAVNAAREQFASTEEALKAAKEEATKELERVKAEKAALEEKLQKSEKAFSDAVGEHQAEVEKINLEHIEEIARIRKESALRVQQMIEFIDVRKGELEKKSDKELLVSAVMALDGYASRMQRLELFMDFHDVETKMTEMRKAFSDSLDSTESRLLEKLQAKALLDRIEAVQSEVNETMDQMQCDLDSKIKSSNENLSSEIESMNTTLSSLMNSLQLPEKLVELSRQIDDLYQKLSRKVDDLLESITEKMEEYDITSSISDLQETVNGIDSTVDNIEERTEGYLDNLSDTVREALDEVKNEMSASGVSYAMDELKSEINSLYMLKSDIDEIKDCVCSSYGSGSIPYMLDQLADAVREAKEAAEGAKEAAERIGD